MSMSEKITYIVYGVFILLMIIGGKFKWRKGEYHEDSTSLEVMKSLRGLAALGVILHHISQHDTFQGNEKLHIAGTIPLFVNAGHFFVAVFFFCSGYGLLKSYITKPDYLKGFIKNRIGKGIILPFYINVIVYGLYFYFTGVHMPLMQWIGNIAGVTMMDTYAWFPIVLALLYLAFYLIFKFVKNRPLAFSLIALCILIQGAIFCVNGHFAWWSGEENWWLDWSVKPEWWQEQKIFWFNGEWWVNSSIAFLVGMVVANYEVAIRKFFGKLYYLKLFITLVLTAASFIMHNIVAAKFGYWTEYNGEGPGIMNKFVTYLSQLPLMIFFVMFIFVVLLKFHAVNPVTKFLGKYSLQTYFMNHLSLFIVEDWIKKQHNPNFKYKYFLVTYLVGVVVLSIVLGIAEHHLTDGISRLIFRKKKVKATT